MRVDLRDMSAEEQKELFGDYYTETRTSELGIVKLEVVVYDAEKTDKTILERDVVYTTIEEAATAVKAMSPVTGGVVGEVTVTMYKEKRSSWGKKYCP